MSEAAAWADLEECESPVSAGDELLWRQVHPRYVDDGVPSSQAFVLSSGDGGKLSVDRGSKVDAEGAFRHYTEEIGNASAGCVSVSTADVEAASARTVDDSDCPQAADSPPRSSAHSYVDLRTLDKGQQRRLRQDLLLAAMNRGGFAFKA